jgi:glyoxylase-like metal-dependent hydrolase (beta-lactamase superfamily II)
VAPLLTIFVTHCDCDHIGGILVLAKNFKTLNKWFKVRNLIFTTPEDKDSRKFILRSIHQLKDLTRFIPPEIVYGSPSLLARGRNSKNESRNSMSILFVE